MFFDEILSLAFIGRIYSPLLFLLDDTTGKM
jgi:hypothetical protein